MNDKHKSVFISIIGDYECKKSLINRYFEHTDNTILNRTYYEREIESDDQRFRVRLWVNKQDTNGLPQPYNFDPDGFNGCIFTYNLKYDLELVDTLLETYSKWVEFFRYKYNIQFSIIGNDSCNITAQNQNLMDTVYKKIDDWCKEKNIQNCLVSTKYDFHVEQAITSLVRKSIPTNNNKNNVNNYNYMNNNSSDLCIIQ